jgi:hypothetical protein
MAVDGLVDFRGVQVAGRGEIDVEEEVAVGVGEGVGLVGELRDFTTLGRIIRVVTRFLKNSSRGS